MKDQHKKIKNYRDLTQEEIDLMNELKEKEQEVLMLCHKISHLNSAIQMDNDLFVQAEPYRWLEMGKFDIQKGFMSLIRAVAKPTNNK